MGGNMALSRLAIRRLTKLANYMARLPKRAEKHFDIREAGPEENVTKAQLLKCGSSACAMGWAATIPSFKKAGWTSGWLHEEEFFAINGTQARELFYDMSIETPKQWASHCRKFIKDNR